MYSLESSSESPPRFWNSGPVLLPLHPVHSELTYILVSELLSTYLLSSSLHSCTYIYQPLSDLWILGSSEAVFVPLEHS